MSTLSSTVIGVALLTRHGDRQGFYQDPLTYTASDTAITPLGEAELYQTGAYLRSIYLNASSPDYIQGISPLTSTYQDSQVYVRADGGGEGTVIMDSALALVQGMWETTTANNDTLANGTTVVSPLGGYQYVPVHSINPNEDITLEGWYDCPAFTNWTDNFYETPEFLQVQSENEEFLQSLTPIAGNRSTTLENAWNLFDFANVNSIHNATFLAELNSIADGTALAQLQALANYHEYGVFTSPDPAGVGNIAGATIIPLVLADLETLSNTSQPIKFTYTAIAYKPFLSIFNLTSPTLASSATPSWEFYANGIVDYGSQMVFELRSVDSTGDLVVRTFFRNGTSGDLAQMYLWGIEGDVDLDTFSSKFDNITAPTLLSWCQRCNQTTSERSCDAALALASSSSITHVSTSHDAVSPVGAGFIGAGVTIALFIIFAIFLRVMGFGISKRSGSGGRTGLMRQQSDLEGSSKASN